MGKPVIGITADLDADRLKLGRGYSRIVTALGGLAVVLPCELDSIEDTLDLLDGVILSGGDDPRMEDWGQPTHPKATPLHPERQQFELALLQAIDDRPDLPALGVCLGMQLMALHAGGTLDQYLPHSLPTAADHWGRVEHAVEGNLGSGTVLSHHRQAMTDAGTLEVIARAPDGVIEAVQHPARCFYRGVQWHPERTSDPRLGAGVFAALIEAARQRRVVGTV